MVGSNRNLPFQGSYFQGRTVSFREGMFDCELVWMISLLEKAISLVKIYNQTIPGDDFFPTMAGVHL